MLSRILKFVLITPVLVTGVSFSGKAFSEERQIKPNIHQMTNNKAAEKADAGTESNDRISGEINKHSIGIGVGQTFLRSDLHDNGNDKITQDLYYNYSASYSFDFVANAHYSTHTYLRSKSTAEGFALSIKGKGFQFDSFAPFVLGGLGFYYPTATRILNDVPVKTRSQLVFGVNLGAGVELRLNRNASVGVIAHYHDPFDVRQDVGPVLEGSYMKLLLLGFYTFN